jgi:exodeoxyribonuclease V gamma subunit
MGELAEQSGYEGMVSAAVIKAWLSMALERAERGFGFITGGVTFCAMLPMRSIPFRVVALIGINDGAFPRQNSAPGFDLAARNPRRGDRSLRDEDRYLFLEALLSARDCFYVSYVGQSIKDNSEVPPSVLVSELFDAIDRGFEREEGGGIADRLLTKHRLQAFSRDYFSPESPLFSYSAANFEALLEREASSEAGGFLKSPLAAPSDGWREVALSQLHSFFKNPAKFFLEKRLRIAMEEIADPMTKREPFSMDGLEGYNLKQELLSVALRGENSGDYLSVARARGLIPPGRHGGIVFETLQRQAEEFSRKALARIGGARRLAPLDVDFSLGEFRLTGRLEDLWPEGMIRFRSAKMKAKDTILAWLDHLVLNASCREGYPHHSLLIMEDEEKAFLPVAAPLPILQSLLDLYWQGLQAPLRFFPASSVAYAAGGKWSLDEARKKWNDGYPDIPGECRDASFRLCFGETAPFDDAFERVAHTVMEPLLMHLEEGRR